jgi:hypothetical protein
MYFFLFLGGGGGGWTRLWFASEAGVVFLEGVLFQW